MSSENRRRCWDAVDALVLLCGHALTPSLVLPAEGNIATSEDPENSLQPSNEMPPVSLKSRPCHLLGQWCQHPEEMLTLRPASALQPEPCPSPASSPQLQQNPHSLKINWMLCFNLRFQLDIDFLEKFSRDSNM